MKFSDYLVLKLSEFIKHVFLLPGGGCIHLIDSFSKSSIDIIPCLHEQGASIAAESYAQFNNSLGVVLVTTGPGSTNAVTGISSAFLDSVPMLIITGQVQKNDLKNLNQRQNGFQEIDSCSIYKSITKKTFQITEIKTAHYILEDAINTAINGRPGPVHIDIPLDIQAMDIENYPLSIKKVDYLEWYSAVNQEKILYDDIINMLYSAKRPVILAGNGIRLSNALPEFYSLIQKLQIPVLTTWKAIDFLEENNPLFIGRPGTISTRGANFNQQNSDLILCIGSRLDHGQIAYNFNKFCSNAKKIIVDVDIEELNKFKKFNNKNTTLVLENAKTFINILLQKIKGELDIKDWINHAKNTYIKYSYLNQESSDISYISNYSLINKLSEILPENQILIPGSSGVCSEVTFQAFKVKRNQRIYNSQGLGSMGFAVPASIGACLASNNQYVVSIEGDGGFVMNIQELELIKRYNLPIHLFILNNGGYGSIKITQNNHFNKNLVACDNSSGLTLPKIESIANAFCIKYHLLTDLNNIENLVNNYKHIPMIIEVLTDPNHVTLPKVGSIKNDDGSFSSNSMENMSPLLDEKILQSELIY